MAHEWTFDIEVHSKDEGFSQARYLVHGWDDVLWTDDIDSAVAFMKESLEEAEND